LASPLSLIHAAILLVLVLLYNIGGKATPVGPLLMGGCRFLNVLLGFSIVSDSLVDWPLRLSAAGIVGVYIVGVTLFARDEARASRPARLRVAFGICAIAVIGAALVPSRGLSLHPYLCAGLLLLLARPAIASFAAPNPMQVQQFVKQSIFGLVYLDAALAIALAGPYGLFVIFWHLPAVILGRRLYST
jgi:4-hydroxybenzoate polyprenyltransferase